MPVQRTVLFSSAAVLALGTGLWMKHDKAAQEESCKNFQPLYTQPIGWISEPHDPLTLFRYSDPKTKLILKGAVNQVISEVNPTPELDTDGIAQYYIDRTKESMPDWTAVKMPQYKGGNTVFRLVRRACSDRVVVTAYAVKGNTTMIVTLFGSGKTMAKVDPNLDSLYRFLDAFSLKEKDMSAL